MPAVDSKTARAVRLALAGPVSLRVLARGEPGLALQIDGGSEKALEAVRISDDGNMISAAAAPVEWLTTSYDVTLHIGQPVSIDLAAPRVSVHAEPDLSGLRIGALSVEVSVRKTESLMAGYSSGEVSATDVGDVSVATARGTVRIGSCTGSARIKSASGMVAIERLDGDGHVRLGAAGLAIGALTGSLEAKSSSGHVSVGVSDGLPAWLDVSSQSGEVVIDVPAVGEPAEGAPYAEVRVRAGSGAVHIYRAASMEEAT